MREDYTAKTLNFENETIVLTDPCYIGKTEKWEMCEYGSHMERLGYTKFITVGNCVGDGDWKVKNQKTGKLLGKICADSGQTGVYLVDEVRKICPVFFKSMVWKNAGVVVLEGFTGQIKFSFREYQDSLDGRVWTEHVLIIDGEGKTKDNVEIQFSVDFDYDYDTGEEE